MKNLENILFVAFKGRKKAFNFFLLKRVIHI